MKLFPRNGIGFYFNIVFRYSYKHFSSSLMEIELVEVGT